MISSDSLTNEGWAVQSRPPTLYKIGGQTARYSSEPAQSHWLFHRHTRTTRKEHSSPVSLYFLRRSWVVLDSFVAGFRDAMIKPSTPHIAMQAFRQIGLADNSTSGAPFNVFYFATTDGERQPFPSMILSTRIDPRHPIRDSRLDWIASSTIALKRGPTFPSAAKFTPLNETHGAPAECRILVEYLDAFKATIDIVMPLTLSSDPVVISNPCPGDTCTVSRLESPHYKQAVDSILRAIWNCKQIMKPLEGRLASFKESLILGSTKSSRLRKMWRKVRWGSIRVQIASIKRDLEAQLHIINTTLSLLSLYRPSTVHHPVPGGIYLTDILNKTIFVPLEWCSNIWEFDKYLSFVFCEKNRHGKEFVERKKYYLMTARFNEYIKNNLWSALVHSNACIIMGAIVERPANMPIDLQVCPSCGATNRVDVTQASHAIQCFSCDTIYQTSGFSSTTSSIVSQILSTSSSHQAVYGKDCSAELEQPDLTHIRRITFVTYPEDDDEFVNDLISMGWIPRGRSRRSTGKDGETRASERRALFFIRRASSILGVQRGVDLLEYTKVSCKTCVATAGELVECIWKPVNTDMALGSVNSPGSQMLYLAFTEESPGASDSMTPDPLSYEEEGYAASLKEERAHLGYELVSRDSPAL
ncbi:hypothetical protein NM688_g4380 [Phlebia brevispora]|uniref:Uncharacterized protein n=1 Tax=Phlebia brevispora TaxID=194682 RepID=A0ACC1T2T6_9APHY|nr:hypothetical protein NM688_g4380 [Phlebia brevispora]